ncbi:4-hydroxythreonine-4-phosphate dehydrogenase [Sulfurimonas marina]|uniref:4-hydroxythreonine-4-phosphate dehydrogenase n=1 Tax=Sulfurimonas marina TaxID=2590551 RepID=A0A7M1AUK0_9BACT|nr:4-hydroxythreonine-4-phosphate dehydrogenase [Sulfurimonas marina]QOP41090.1 4-hydroxythreonine-4-phosphate dehydrogenase [Sulfurimonas marina]
MKPKIAISVGDLNGVGIEIALKSHETISKICTPIYCINNTMLAQAAKLLDVTLPQDLELFEVEGEFTIEPGVVSKESGLYSYDSFMTAIKLCETKEADAVVTMPIHKEAWKLADLHFVGHTDLLRKYFNKEAIMMLGCPEMFVALFTEHMPLREVPSHIKADKITTFLLDLHKSIGDKEVAVLGLNPHAGDNGVLGDEEREIELAIADVNKQIGKELFHGCIVPDIAFTPSFRKNFNYYVAMYHDQGLAPLKALYFDESVNISLNLPIIRTSVDHGTAFDIAYKNQAKTLSYLNGIKSALSFINN